MGMQVQCAAALRCQLRNVIHTLTANARKDKAGDSNVSHKGSVLINSLRNQWNTVNVHNDTAATRHGNA